MNVRPLPLALGVVAFLAAIALSAGVATIGVGEEFVVAAGLVALLGAIVAVGRRRGRREPQETPDPERRHRASVPGGHLSETVDQFRADGSRYNTSTGRIREGLREAVVAVLTRFEGLSTEEARERIDDGTWTDDPYAAGFLSPSLESPRESTRERLASALRGRRAFRQDVRRTAAAVASIGYGGLDAGDDGPAPKFREEDDDEIVPHTTTSGVEGILQRSDRETDHWTGVGVVSLAAVGVGAVAESPAVLLAGAVGIGYAGFARAFDAPTPDLRLERTVSEDAPDPGDEVDVSTTITNESGRFLADLRIVDGVPSGLAVTDGTARLGTALRPGEEVSLEYTVTARRGRHEFDPALVVTRDLSRSREREFLVGHETTIVSEPTLQPVAAPVPLRAAAATFAGRLTTAEGGSGTEFHSVREYRRSDPLSRVDWNRHARTGELATLQFHEERAARVVVLVDAREAAYVAPEPDAAHAVDRSVEAAGRIATSLLDDGDAVGLAALGPVNRGEPRATVDADPCWLAPSSGHHHRTRMERLLATHPQFSTLPPSGRARWHLQLRRIRRRLSAETQVIVLTPLCDRFSAEIARRLDSRGHPVTVVSPDPTAERTASQQLARVARRIRRFDLQRVGIPVVDWRHDDTIDETFARTAGERR